MARETKTKSKSAATTKAHCRHCGTEAKVKDGRVQSHPDPQSSIGSECAGTNAPPLD